MKVKESSNDTPDRLAVQALFERFMKKAKILEEKHATLYIEDSKLTEEFVTKIVSDIIKINIAVLDAEFTFSQRTMVVKTIIKMLIESLTPNEVYGMFSTIKYELQEEIRRSMPMSILMTVPRTMEESKEDEENILAI